MRRIVIPLVAACLTLAMLGSAALVKTRAKSETAVLVQSPGRCTSLKYEAKPKTKTGTAPTSAAPGGRCTRLSAGGPPGTVLPNTAPNVGLATSTAYIAGAASPRVNLKAIACDAEKDTLLYTYSSTGGRITGEGATAAWDLSGVSPGTYTVSVEVDDGCGCVSFDSSDVTLE